MRAGLFAALTCVLAGGAVLLGTQSQAPSSESTPPVFRSSAEAIQVTAIVTDADGNPVAGLTEADFEILEGGMPQPITTFSAVEIPIERTEYTGGDPDVLGNDGPPGRVYLIALDEVSPENSLRTRHFLRQFIEQYFGPNDTAAVVLTGRGLSTDGQEFTGNPRLVLEAIDKFGGGFAGDTPPARSKLKDFRALMEFMAKVSGRRKAMIYVSEGIPADAYDLVDYVPGPLNGMFAVVDPDFQAAVSAATRGNVTIYTIDPSGLTTEFGGQESRGTLSSLAEVTGGFSLSNSNSYAGAFDRLVRENSTYYLLGFNTAYERRDGRYVRLEVRVRRPGLEVRSLDGYVAPRGSPRREPERRNVLLPAVWDAVSSPVTVSGVPMRVFAAPYRGADNRKDATVTVSLEIAASKLHLVESDGAYRGELEIVFAITDATKKRRPLIRHRAALALKPETYARVARSGLRVLSQLALPEGRYQLRVSAGGAAVAGSVVYDLSVPDFRDDLAMSGVALVSAQARDTMTVIPETRVNVGLPGPPTTAREFSRDDVLTFYAEVYESRRKPHTVDFTTELRDDAGRVVSTFTQQEGTTRKAAGAYYFSPNLLLEDLPAGRYTVRLEARSSLDSKNPVTREISIQVR